MAESGAEGSQEVPQKMTFYLCRKLVCGIIGVGSRDVPCSYFWTKYIMTNLCKMLRHPSDLRQQWRKGIHKPMPLRPFSI